MKAGLVIREFHNLETHLNRIRDLAGSLCKISSTTSSGRQSDIASYPSISLLSRLHQIQNSKVETLRNGVNMGECSENDAVV